MVFRNMVGTIFWDVNIHHNRIVELISQYVIVAIALTPRSSI